MAGLPADNRQPPQTGGGTRQRRGSAALLQEVVLAVGILTLAAVAAYVIGSMSPSHVTPRAVAGIDLRMYGSGTVSGSNVWRSVARWAVVSVVIIEVLKGVGAVLVARALGLDLWWEVYRPRAVCRLCWHAKADTILDGRAGSSAVELRTFNPGVVGSNPTRPSRLPF